MARILVIVSLCACSAGEEPQRIDVRGPNELGATVLETERLTDGRDSVFELRAFDAASQQVGTVRFHVGDIPDLLQWLPGSDRFGSELVVSAAGTDRRIVSREVRGRTLSETDNRSLLSIPEVESALRPANIIVQRAAKAPVETAYYTEACSGWMLQQSPVAQQCCWDRMVVDYPTVWTSGTVAIRASDGAMVRRWYNFVNQGLGGCRGSSFVLIGDSAQDDALV